MNKSDCGQKIFEIKDLDLKGEKLFSYKIKSINSGQACISSSERDGDKRRVGKKKSKEIEKKNHVNELTTN